MPLSDRYSIQRAIVEGQMAHYAMDLTLFNRQAGIHILAPLPQRFIGFSFFLATRSVISAFSFIDIAKSLRIFIEEPLDFPDFKCLVKKLNSSTNCPSSTRLFIIERLYSAYGFDAHFVHDIFEYFDYSNLSLAEKRDLYSAFRVYCERPLFINLDSTNHSLNKYIEKLITDIENNLTIQHPIPLGSKEKDRERVLFFYGHLQVLPNIGSHLRQVASYALGYALTYPNKKVQLLISNEASTKDFALNFHALPRNWKQQASKQLLNVLGLSEFPSNFELSLFSPFDKSDYFSDVTNAINSFSPQFAFSWLGFFSANLLFNYVSNWCPIVSIQFQAGNQPNVHSKNILAQGDLANQAVEKASNFNYINHPIPMVPEEKLRKRTKNDVNPSEAFLVVTTLGNGRIEKAFSRYSHDFIKRFLKLFDDFIDLEWILVGVTDSAAIVSADKGLLDLVQSGRIKLYERIEDLRSFYEHCNMYVHLPGLHGGGWGIALASVEELPVLSQAGGDADNFLPSSCIFHNESEFIDKFNTCITSESVATKLVEEQLDKLSQHNIKNVARFLDGLISEVSD